MPLQILFWMIYIIALFFGLWINYIPNEPYPLRRPGWVLVMFVLIGLLGWRVFGEAVHN